MGDLKPWQTVVNLASISEVALLRNVYMHYTLLDQIAVSFSK